jgi:hypothetical protein
MRHLFRAACVVVLGAACSHEPAPGESVAEVCDPDDHEQQVTVSGYLVAPFITIGCNESCSLQLSATADDRDGIRLTFPVGVGPRTMDRIGRHDGRTVAGQVERLNRWDFTLRDDDGNTVHPGDVVRVEGKLHVGEHDGRPDCTIERAAHVQEL